MAAPRETTTSSNPFFNCPQGTDDASSRKPNAIAAYRHSTTPMSQTESGAHRRIAGKATRVTITPAPVGFPAETMPSLPRIAFPWSCGIRCHSFGSTYQVRNAERNVPNERSNAWDRNRRNGPKCSSSTYESQYNITPSLLPPV